MLFYSCYRSERKCEDFEQGTFEWTQEIEGETVTTRFVRTDDYQIEYFKEEVDSAKITWINDCEYRIKPINPKSNAESRAYLFKITRTDGDRYYFQFEQSGLDQVFDGSAVKVQD